MRKAFLLGTGFASLCATSLNQPLQAATLDDVVARLDALERSNAKLSKENAQLRERVNHMGEPKAAVAAVAPGSPKGNPVLHAAVAPSPAPAPSAPEHTVVSIGGAPLYSKASGGNAFIDNTTVAVRPCRSGRRHL